MVSNAEVSGPVFKTALVWMVENPGKPEPNEDKDEDELTQKEFVRTGTN